MVRESKRLRCHLTRLNWVLVVSLNLPSGVKIQQITAQMWSFKQTAFLPPSSLSAVWAEKRIYQRCKLAEVYFLVEQLLIRTISSTGKISHTCRKKLITAPQSPSVSIRCHGNMSAVEEGGMNFLLAKYAGWPTSTIWKASENPVFVSEHCKFWNLSLISLLLSVAISHSTIGVEKGYAALSFAPH